MFCKAVILSVIGWTSTHGSVRQAFRGMKQAFGLSNMAVGKDSFAEPPQSKAFGQAPTPTNSSLPSSDSNEIDPLLSSNLSKDHPVSMSQDQLVSNVQTPSQTGQRALEKPMMEGKETRPSIGYSPVQRDVSDVSLIIDDDTADTCGSMILRVPWNKAVAGVVLGLVATGLVVVAVPSVLAMQSNSPTASSVLPVHQEFAMHVPLDTSTSMYGPTTTTAENPPTTMFSSTTTTGELSTTMGEPTTSTTEIPWIYSGPALVKNHKHCADEAQVIRVQAKRCMPVSLPAIEKVFPSSVCAEQSTCFKDLDLDNNTIVEKKEFYRKMKHWEINGHEYVQPERCPLTYSRADLYEGCLYEATYYNFCSNPVNNPEPAQYQDLLEKLDSNKNGYLSDYEIINGLGCFNEHSEGYKTLLEKFSASATFSDSKAASDAFAELVFDILSGSVLDKERLKLPSGMSAEQMYLEIFKNIPNIAPSYVSLSPRPTLHLKEDADPVRLKPPGDSYSIDRHSASCIDEIDLIKVLKNKCTGGLVLPTADDTYIEKHIKTVPTTSFDEFDHAIRI